MAWTRRKQLHINLVANAGPGLPKAPLLREWRGPAQFEIGSEAQASPGISAAALRRDSWLIIQLFEATRFKKVNRRDSWSPVPESVSFSAFLVLDCYQWFATISFCSCLLLGQSA
jgi:hypothetical protein